MTTIYHPQRCPICSHYLTTSEAYAGCRCKEPGHWIAAGVLTSNDFCDMARIVAETRDNLPSAEIPAHEFLR